MRYVVLMFLSLNLYAQSESCEQFVQKLESCAVFKCHEDISDRYKKAFPDLTAKVLLSYEVEGMKSDKCHFSMLNSMSGTSICSLSQKSLKAFARMQVLNQSLSSQLGEWDEKNIEKMEAQIKHMEQVGKEMEEIKKNNPELIRACRHSQEGIDPQFRKLLPVPN